MRRRKVESLRSRGVDPYPNDFVPECTTADVHGRFGPLDSERLAAIRDPVSVAGRILTRRDFGKASFFHLQDLPLSFFTEHASGTLTSRVIYDIAMIRRSVSKAGFSISAKRTDLSTSRARSRRTAGYLDLSLP